MRKIPGALLALMVTAFVETLGSFLIVALLPFYASRYGASATQIGFLVSAFAVAQMITAPIWGRLSDRYGRRPAILGGLAIMSLAYVVFALADSLPLLLVCRLAQGAGAGIVPVLFAFVSDVVPEESRAQGIGWLTAVTSSAAMLGPAMGSSVLRLDPSAPGWFTAGFCGAALLFSWRFLPESATKSSSAEASAPGAPGVLGSTLPQRQGLVARTVDVATHPTRPVHALIWIYALAQLAMSGLVAIIALYLQAEFGVDDTNVWIFFAYLGGLSIVFRVLLLGPVIRRFGEVPTLSLGCLVFGAGLVALPACETVWGLALVVPLIPLGTALVFPATTAQVSKRSPDPDQVGATLGVQQAYGSAAKIAAPLAAGLLFDRFSSASPLLVAGGVMFLAALWSWQSLMRAPTNGSSRGRQGAA